MKPIGGYFGLELPISATSLHGDGVKVNSGRNALEYIFRSIGTENISHVYVPDYTCPVVLTPLRRLGIPYTFYTVNKNFEVDELPKLGEDEYLIVNNYFGLKDNYIKEVCHSMPKRVIVDNSQALYCPSPEEQQAFYSPRKFLGMPDGGIAYAFRDFPLHEKDISHSRCSHLLKRIDEGAQAGYDDFHINSKALADLPLMEMSRLSHAFFSTADHEAIRQRRLANYRFLREHLEPSNLLSTPEAEDISCPLVYPYLSEDTGLRSYLIEHQIFVARYWPGVEEWANKDSLPCLLSENLIALPIDQRYGAEDMNSIIQQIQAYDR